MISKGASVQGGGCRLDLHTKVNTSESTEEKRRVHVGFIDLEEVYDRVNVKACGRCSECMMWKLKC